MSNCRIVITGMGAVSPLGCDVEAIWQRLLKGESGIRALPDEIVADLPVKVGGQVPALAQDAEAGFNPDASVAPKDQKKMDRFILFAMAAADEAIRQAGWIADTDEKQERTATVIASGIGGFPAIAQAVRTTDSRGAKRLSPFTIPSFLVNLAAGHVSIKHHFKGPIGAPVTACAAGVQAIGDAVRMIRNDEADIAVCGGTEAAIDTVSLGGFAAARAMSTAPAELAQQASRPFDSTQLSSMDPKDGSVVVLGYTDAVGSDQYNQKLSEQRAQSVVDYLVSKGIPSDKISARGMGEADAVTGNTCGYKSGRATKAQIACLAPDRRVEIEVKGIKDVVTQPQG